MRIIFPQELDAIIKYNGFVLVEKFGDYDGSRFLADSPKQLAITRLP